MKKRRHQPHLSANRKRAPTQRKKTDRPRNGEKPKRNGPEKSYQFSRRGRRPARSAHPITRFLWADRDIRPTVTKNISEHPHRRTNAACQGNLLFLEPGALELRGTELWSAGGRRPGAGRCLTYFSPDPAPAGCRPEARGLSEPGSVPDGGRLATLPPPKRCST